MHVFPFRLLADLNSPLFTPDAISLDRKHILEDIESKYREFITATLRCLSELKRELCEWHMDDTVFYLATVSSRMRLHLIFICMSFFF